MDYFARDNFHFALRMYELEEKDWSRPILFVSHKELISYIESYYQMVVNDEFKRWARDSQSIRTIGEVWEDDDFFVVKI